MRFAWSTLVSIIAWMLLTGRLVIECKESCFYVILTYCNWTDDRPRFVVNMTFSNQTGIGSITTINEEIASPVSRILIVQRSGKEKSRTIYNASTRLCDLQNVFNSVPLFKPAKDSVLKQSNYTMSCPLTKGTYAMNNMRINPKNPLLSLLYQPKHYFMVKGGLYEELPRGRMRPLSTYFMRGKVIKRSCGANE
ncbi:uncharacterized protein LOC117581899 [Drosophila guanche]|uniref:MD-2-related lipid-recognition domain-containing protein n=1 Tax=Drosophila guanche TaxID=7266 RepID=A0A3B0JA70_DROGU|nr:uncharacterized protein LOC117581899 [Drosophila guanche]SPP79194.1 Hypothetical predicted protein [Drosophila guanche]